MVGHCYIYPDDIYKRENPAHLHCILIKRIGGIMISVVISDAVGHCTSPGWVRSITVKLVPGNRAALE